jgi:tetratricopeptide (TPR) repeat protein
MIERSAAKEGVLPAKGLAHRRGTGSGLAGGRGFVINRMRRGGAVALALALGYAGYLGAQSWHYRAALKQAQRDLSRGNHAAAVTEFAALANRWPGLAEVEYGLGECELAQGKPDAALAAWARIPPQSPLGVDVAPVRGRLALERGRFADAERVLTAALAVSPGGSRTVEVRQLLIHLFVQQGRYDEAQALLERQWRDLAAINPAEALAALQAHAIIDLDTTPLTGLRAVLDRAATLAPGDGRVALARANLATREGRLADAKGALHEARRAGPADSAIERAWLRWALAAGRDDEAAAAAAALGPGGLSADERLALDAWRAARRGDRRGERAAWERLLAAGPDRPAVLERLATLALADGDNSRAAELRRRKAVIDEALTRYRTVAVAGRLADDPRALAQLAAALGRRFEAHALLSIAVRRAPSNREARRALDATSDDPAAAPAALALSVVGLALDHLAACNGPPAEVAAADVPRFIDDAGPSGLGFVFRSGETSLHQLPEVMAGGVGLLDFDGDGFLDVYAVQGGPFPPAVPPGIPGDRLFRNRGDGTFEDVTERSGLGRAGTGYGHGVAVGDIDNDGRPDLFLTRWHSYRLLRNRGDGTFEAATGPAGLGGDRGWPTSAAFADLDGDGDLDLYVCHYVAWDAAQPRLCLSPARPGYTSCDPKTLEPEPDHVFRNDGGRFTDVTAKSGLAETTGRGLGVVAADLDGDGRIDLFVANDGSPNFFWRNLGGFRFQEAGLASGLSANASGGYQAGMGVACGDLDGDGGVDLAVTNFLGESTSFYKNLGGGDFYEQSAAVGLVAATRSMLGFGVAFIDANNDGRLDLLSANGHVNDFRPNAAYAMPPQLLLGRPGGTLADVSARAGEPFQATHLGRGLAAGDIDNDGLTDALIVALDESLVVLRNRSKTSGHWLTLSLAGAASSRDAVGAIVTVRHRGGRQVAVRSGGGSYLSAGDPRLHFGLGASRLAESVEVRWPSGRVDTFADLEVDRGYLLHEGDLAARPLTGFRARAGR